MSRGRDNFVSRDAFPWFWTFILDVLVRQRIIMPVCAFVFLVVLCEAVRAKHRTVYSGLAFKSPNLSTKPVAVWLFMSGGASPRICASDYEALIARVLAKTLAAIAMRLMRCAMHSYFDTLHVRLCHRHAQWIPRMHHGRRDGVVQINAVGVLLCDQVQDQCTIGTISHMHHTTTHTYVHVVTMETSTTKCICLIVCVYLADLNWISAQHLNFPIKWWWSVRP